MNNQSKTLEEIQATLATLRESPGFRNRFPKQLWDSIIELAKVLPLQEICRQLEIQPAYLKHKIQQSKTVLSDTVDFQEISHSIQNPHLNSNVVIELISASGLRAKIQILQLALVAFLRYLEVNNVAD